jgi:hypothetical protein
MAVKFMDTIPTPKSFSVILIFLLLNAFIWFGFSIIAAANLHPGLHDNSLYRWGMAILAIIASVALFVLWYFLKRKNKFAYYLTAAFLIVIIILTFTDDLGFLDLVVLVIEIIPLVLLISLRKWYFASEA